MRREKEVRLLILGHMMDILFVTKTFKLLSYK